MKSIEGVKGIGQLIGKGVTGSDRSLNTLRSESRGALINVVGSDVFHFVQRLTLSRFHEISQ
jgi:hypothetical protein